MYKDARLIGILFSHYNIATVRTHYSSSLVLMPFGDMLTLTTHIH